MVDLTPPRGPAALDAVMPWSVVRRQGTAAEMHQDPPVPAGRELAIVEATDAALVLGSTQPEASINVAALDAAGLSWCRRGSGGGSVLLMPGEHLWVDITIRSDDPAWTDDVGAAAVGVGQWWVDMLGLGTVAQGAYQPGEHGRRVCFAGVGPGEVMVGSRKLVGISQRRNRERARFQCVVHGTFQAALHGALLAEPLDDNAVSALAAGVGITDIDRLARHLSTISSTD